VCAPTPLFFFHPSPSRGSRADGREKRVRVYIDGGHSLHPPRGGHPKEGGVRRRVLAVRSGARTPTIHPTTHGAPIAHATAHAGLAGRFTVCADLPRSLQPARHPLAPASRRGGVHTPTPPHTHPHPLLLEGRITNVVVPSQVLRRTLAGSIAATSFSRAKPPGSRRLVRAIAHDESERGSKKKRGWVCYPHPPPLLLRD
jgi:hypothetical protein